MRKLVVLTFVSLDGVMQAPGGKGEDPSNDFEHEGWSVPYFDQKLGEEMSQQMSEPFDLLLGRKTYDLFAAYWPSHPQEGEGINKATKYVVSNGAVDTSWKETIQIRGDIIAEIKKLKQQNGPMLQVHGSSMLLQALWANNVVDELWLKIFPVVIGKGKRLFEQGVKPTAFELVKSSTTPSGVLIANYRLSGEVKTGSFN